MSENTILLLTDDHIDWFAQKFDDKFDFTKIIKNKFVGNIAEALDKKAAKISLNFFNVRVSPYIPDEYKDEVHAALNDVTDDDGKYDDALTNALDILDQLKDKLKVADWIKSLIDSLIDMLKAVLLSLMNTKEDNV